MAYSNGPTIFLNYQFPFVAFRVSIRLCFAFSAFEPEARGHLVQGMDFHRFYFEIDGGGSQVNTTICDPRVRLLGDDVALITYVRLTQRIDAGKNPLTTKCEETRLWQRQADGWRHVHFHRSVND